MVISAVKIKGQRTINMFYVQTTAGITGVQICRLKGQKSSEICQKVSLFHFSSLICAYSTRSYKRSSPQLHVAAVAYRCGLTLLGEGGEQEPGGQAWNTSPACY